MRTVRDDSENVARWVAARLPEVGPVGFGKCKAIGVVARDGSPLGGAVFHNYQPHFKTITISCAADSPKWVTRNIITEILAYAFEEVGVFKAWSAISIKNKRSMRLCEGIGFSKEATLRHHLGYGNHAVVFGMLAPEFREKYRKDKP